MTIAIGIDISLIIIHRIIICNYIIMSIRIFICISIFIAMNICNYFNVTDNNIDIIKIITYTLYVYLQM